MACCEFDNAPPRGRSLPQPMSSAEQHGVLLRPYASQHTGGTKQAVLLYKRPSTAQGSVLSYQIVGV